MISVIIPTYIINDILSELTDKCLETIRLYTKEKIELIIIDNASPMKKKYDCDVYVRNKVNKGNGAAWNQGFRLASGDHILLADNDVEFEPGWEELAKYTDKAVAFPQTMLQEDMTYKNRLAGFFWMIDRKTLNTVGLIDEKFGLANFEDTDYFKRCQDKGIMLRAIDKVKIFHNGRSTCDQVPEVKETYERNRLYYESKHGPNYPKLN